MCVGRTFTHGIKAIKYVIILAPPLAPAPSRNSALLGTNALRAAFSRGVLGASVMRRRAAFLAEGVDSWKARKGGVGRVSGGAGAGAGESLGSGGGWDAGRPRRLLIAHLADQHLDTLTGELTDKLTEPQGPGLSFFWELLEASFSEVPGGSLEPSDLDDAWLETVAARRDELGTLASAAVAAAAGVAAAAEEGKAMTVSAAAAAESLGAAHSLPGWLAEAWVRRWGAAQAEAIAKCANEPGPITLRRNPAVRTRMTPPLPFSST